MLILYEGASQLDGKPIVVLLTGDERPSANRKTGPMLQVWYLRSDISPTEAVKTGEDASICGDCPHRNGTCYVLVHQAPSGIWTAYKQGKGRRPSDVELFELLHYRKVRLGAYGNPSSAPYAVNDRIFRWARDYTGYDAMWRLFPEYAGKLMASVSTEDEALIAKSQGWSTYRIKLEGAPELSHERPCPSNKGVTCSECLICNGSRGSRTIEVHGAAHKQKRFSLLLQPQTSAA